MTTPPSAFAQFVESQAAAPGGPLPLAHTTDAWRFRFLLQQPVLRTERCLVYEEDLLYFFYGKPAYRPHYGVDPTTLPAYLPVSFVLAPMIAPQPIRIMPFDSGAMSTGQFGSFFHPGMQRGDFDLGSRLENADRLIGFFFGTAQAYYVGTAKKGAIIPPLQFEAIHYFSLITYDAISTFDERRSAIEVQFNTSIDLVSQRVLAVALPGSFMDDPSVKNFVENVLKAKPLEYAAYHAQPRENVRAIVDLVSSFYQQQGII